VNSRNPSESEAIFHDTKKINSEVGGISRNPSESEAIFHKWQHIVVTQFRCRNPSESEAIFHKIINVKEVENVVTLPNRKPFSTPMREKLKK